LKEEYRWKVPENSLWRIIFGQEEQGTRASKKWHNEEVCDMHSSPYII
jgi:hypothetical protein